MTWGDGGKYEEDCTRMLLRDDADLVIVLVTGGVKGSGFSVSSRSALLLEQLPGLLEQMAAKIRFDMQAKGNA